MKMYIVQCRHYEYNDETYEATDGGNVVHAYSTLKAAEDAAAKMTVEEFKQGRFDYFYDANTRDFSEDALRVFESHGAAPECSYFSFDDCEEISASMQRGHYSDEELDKIARGLPDWKALFFVEEVDVD